MTQMAHFGHVGFHIAGMIMSKTISTLNTPSIQMGTYEKVDLEAYWKEVPTDTQKKIKQKLNLEQNVIGEKRMQDLNMDELRTFRYNHLCDKWNCANNENYDDEDLLWEPIAN